MKAPYFNPSKLLGALKTNRSTLMMFAALAALLMLPFQVQGSARALDDAGKKDAVYRMYADYKKAFPAVRDISPRDARTAFDEGRVIFVDTRQPEEMSVSMLPGAVSSDEYLRHSERYADKTAVAYCTISYRSGLFARDQAEQGLAMVNLKGGILAWILEGGPVVDAAGNPTRSVHVYGDKWDLATDSWESVKFSLWEKVF